MINYQDQMGTIENQINSPEDIQRVTLARGEAETNLGVMGNNDSERDRIEMIWQNFESRKINADKAIEDLNLVWRSKQMGAM